MNDPIVLMVLVFIGYAALTYAWVECTVPFIKELWRDYENARKRVDILRSEQKCPHCGWRNDPLAFGKRDDRESETRKT